MSSIFAQLNSDNVCISVIEYETAVPESLDTSKHISISTFDVSLVGKRRNGDSWEDMTSPETEESARNWRNLELNDTDILMLLDDYPNTTNLRTYRQALRDWPSTSNFPNTKPVLATE